MGFNSAFEGLNKAVCVLSVKGWHGMKKYNKHNPCTQDTSLKRTQNTCILSQRSPTHH